MGYNLGVTVVTWAEKWWTFSEEEKNELLNTDNTGEYLGYSSRVFVVYSCLVDSFGARKNDVIEDIYKRVLNLGYDNDKEYSPYEFLLRWIVSEMKCGALDEYRCEISLADYYHRIIKDYSLAVELYKKAYSFIQKYDNDNTFRDSVRRAYSTCVYNMILALIDNGQFDESRWWEQEMLMKGYFSVEEDGIIMIHLCRLNEEIRKLSKQGIVLSDIGDISLFEKNRPDLAAWFYKKVAHQYYKQRDYLKAKELYEKAYSFNPGLVGVESKLRIIRKRLPHNDNEEKSMDERRS